MIKYYVSPTKSELDIKMSFQYWTRGWGLNFTVIDREFNIYKLKN